MCSNFRCAIHSYSSAGQTRTHLTRLLTRQLQLHTKPNLLKEINAKVLKSSACLPARPPACQPASRKEKC